MKGKYHVIVQNSRVKFEFDIRRNITIVRGDSATGKTTLMTLIEAHDRLGEDSGVAVSCARRCIAINNANWEAVLGSASSCIVFADEDTKAVRSVEFARMVRSTDNYYVIITREDLPNLPYSVDEIYGIHSSGKHADLRKTYNSFYRLYGPVNLEGVGVASRVLVEDSNSGYEFFRAAVDEGISVTSAGGKGNIRHLLLEYGDERTVVIADGAAFGPEMAEVYIFAKTHKNVHLYLPESFEWIVLDSGIVDDNRVKEILRHPEDYVESRECFSWEQFFTRLLVQETEGTYLRYSKHKLNEAYLNGREFQAMLAVLGKLRALLTGVTDGYAKRDTEAGDGGVIADK